MKVFNSKEATARCEHGFITQNCPSCNPAGRAEQHHGRVFNLIQHLVPTLNEFALVGRPEHPNIIQNTINEVAADHKSTFPECRYCEILQDPQRAPDIMDLLNEEPTSYVAPTAHIPDEHEHTFVDEPTTEIKYEPTEVLPQVKAERFIDFD